MQRRSTIGLVICAPVVAGVTGWVFRRQGITWLPVVAALIASGCFVAMRRAWWLSRQTVELVTRAASKTRQANLGNQRGAKR